METDAGIRIVGLLLLGIGAAASYFCIYETIVEAQARKPSVETYEGVAMICIALLLYGFVMLVGGKRVQSFVVVQKNAMKPLQVLVILLIILAGLAFQIWFDSYLKSLGYTVRSPWGK